MTNAVGISSQDAMVDFREEDTPEDMAQSVNEALGLVRDDIQRLAAATQPGTTVAFGSGNYRAVAPASGIVQVWAVSDTATAGSTGVNYHTLTLYRNGSAANSQTYDTRRTEIPAYQGGVYLGESSVAEGDMLVANLAVAGVPAPTLTSDNFCLRCTLRKV